MSDVNKANKDIGIFSLENIKSVWENLKKGIGILPDPQKGILDVITLSQQLSATLSGASIGGAMDGILKGVDDFIGNKLEGAGTRLTNILIDSFVADKTLEDDVADKMKAMFKNIGAVSPLLMVLASAVFILDHLKVLMTTTDELVNQSMNQKIRQNLPSGEGLLGAAFIDPPTTARVRAILEKEGFQDHDIDLIFKAAYNSYDEGTIRTLFLRGEISEDKMRARMHELRYTDGRIDDIIKSWSLIPGPSDLLQMVVKEAFDDSASARFGHDENQPEAAYAWLEKQGISREWGKRYWRAHWNLPGLQEVFEMLHRGLATDDDVSEYLRIADYSPFWRERLQQISYNNYTRVDLRRIFELGLIDKEGLIREYQNMGYRLDKANLLANWTEIEYAQENKNVTASSILSEYLDGFITEQDARDNLRRLGYLDNRIDILIAHGSYKRAYAQQKERVTALRKLFISGQMDATDVRNELKVYMIDDRRIDELLSTWQLDRRAGLAMPRVTDLNTFAEQGVINENQYKLELKRIGYPDVLIDVYWNSLMVKAGKEIEKTSAVDTGKPTGGIPRPSRADLDRWFIQSLITERDYKDGLINLGYTTADADRFYRSVVLQKEEKVNASKL